MSDASGVFSTEPKYWWRNFKAIWHVDFEYRQDANHLPVPVCMHAYERHTGTEIAMRRGQLLACRRAPFDTGTDSVMVAYAANAEISCFLAGNWPLPHNVIDVYVETIAGINGDLDVWPEKRRPKLPEALKLYGLTPAMSVEEKDRMRDVILGHTDYTEEQWQQIQTYNCVDIDETADLEEALAPSLDLPRALFRGRYSGAAVALMEATGLPIDTANLDCLLESWDPIERHYIARDDIFGLYEDTSLREARLCNLIDALGWDWPLTEHGRPVLERKTLGQQAKRYPQLKPLVRLRDLIAELRIGALANTVGADGFSRCPLLPFWTRTGRNQPSGRDKIFLPALPAWIHGLIKPPPGWGCAELDWDGQEIAVVAGCSGDPALIEDYLSGDPHLRFGKRAGLVPADATKDTPGIGEFRNKILKPVTLGQIYGMTPYGIAAKTDKSLPWARNIHARHRQIYPVLHRWLGDVVAQAKFDRVIYSPFGWPQAVTGSISDRSLKNYLAQSGGADMMRIAAIAATEAGIRICAPVHDAFWIMAPLDELDATIARMKEIMIEASVAVTGGLPAGVTVEYVVRWPQCLGDVRKPNDKGQAMWAEIKDLLRSGRLQREAS